MRHLVVALRLVLPAACAALWCSTAAAGPSYEVVLASGARVTASSRPLVAMGKVSFLDEARRPVSLPSTAVDVEATRARLGGTQASGKVWDEKSLAKLDASRIQFYGDQPADGATPSEAAATTAKDEDSSPAERLRAQIDGLSEKIRTLPTSDRQRSIMVIRQLELQQELTRILTTPPARG